MRVKIGAVELSESLSTCALWLDVTGRSGNVSGSLLTPAQAMKLAARLQRWAWKQSEKKGAKR